MSSQVVSTAGQPSRRTLLKTAGAAGVAASAGALGRQIFSPAIAAPAPKMRLAWTEVAACHSPLGFGVAKGFYAKHNVDVDLYYQGASGQTLIQALATNKADAGAGLIGDWLKPLEQGFDVKIFVGSHGGCQRLLASSSIRGQGHRGRQGQDDRDLRARVAAPGCVPVHAVQSGHRSQR